LAKELFLILRFGDHRRRKVRPIFLWRFTNGKMGTPNLMKTDAILAAWHRADGLSFNHSILVPAALPLQPKRDRP
jgi:hypothetical protein